MRRTVRTALAATAFLVASLALAQAPATPLYPLKPNTKWTYKVGDATIVVRVAPGDQKDGVTLETLVNDRVVASEVIQVKADGVYRTKINKNAVGPPVLILQLKDGQAAAKGTSWQVDSKIVEQSVKGKFTIKDDKEKVKLPTTPPSEVDAVAVDGPDFEIAGTKAVIRYWFAADKGIVKLTYNIAGNDATLELKEYAEGK